MALVAHIYGLRSVLRRQSPSFRRSFISNVAQPSSSSVWLASCSDCLVPCHSFLNIPQLSQSSAIRCSMPSTSSLPMFSCLAVACSCRSSQAGWLTKNCYIRHLATTAGRPHGSTIGSCCSYVMLHLSASSSYSSVDLAF